MRTQGEIEAAVCDGITRFEQEYMGRGPLEKAIVSVVPMPSSSGCRAASSTMRASA